MNMNEKKIEEHNDFINDVMLYGRYGFNHPNEIYLFRDWFLESTEYMSLGARLLLKIGDKEIKEENRFFITEKNKKRYAEVMDEDGSSYQLELDKKAILYTYCSDLNCCLEDSENKFIRSYTCKFWILEHDGKIYIPKYYSFEDVFRNKYKDDIDLSLLIEESNLDNFDDVDAEFLDRLVDTLYVNGFKKLAKKIGKEDIETFFEATTYVEEKMFGFNFSQVRLINGILKDYKKEYLDTLSENISIEEEEDLEYDMEMDDGYINSPVWYDIKRARNNNIVIISMHFKEEKRSKMILKMITKKKYYNNQEIIANAFNNLCLSLVFQNQCWHEEYRGDQCQ